MGEDRQRQGFGAGLAAGLPPEMRRLALAIVALFLIADLIVATLCPLYGGDCLYGLFTLVAAPVMAAGLLGVLLPRAARAAGWARGARLAVLAGGGAAALVLVAVGHVAAVGWANALDYGGVLVKPRLLAVTLGLAAVYYAALAVIGLARRRDV